MTSALAGPAHKASDARVKSAAAAAPAPIHSILSNIIISIISANRIRSGNGPIGHRGRCVMTMGRRRARRYPMKMVRRGMRSVARCHEHGMDRDNSFEEFCAASE
jgi:hypothetical protein